MAVSGWLIGSTPTRLIMLVTVPSASASTHAARCSSPRWGRPGSRTHPEAAPEHSGSDGVVSEGGCSIINAGGCLPAKCPGSTADSPTTVPSARTRPTVPGRGCSGNSSRTPKIVVVESNPGRDATRTAMIRSWAHSLVESGQRPETTKPFNVPREWNGDISTARPELLSISPPRHLDKSQCDTTAGRFATAWGTAALAHNRTRVLKNRRGARAMRQRPVQTRGGQPKMRPLVFEVAAA